MDDESLDYWRVSDTVLTPSQFLNAIPSTLAYWRLDGDANGMMNADDFVGNAHLADNLDTSSSIRGGPKQAFADQPPNSTVTLTEGNTGSAYSQAANACLQTANLGAQLEITNSFTVEGWLYPQRESYNADLQYIANTRISDKGWAFALKKIADTRKLVIFAEDSAGQQAFDAPLTGDLSDWTNAWKHVALVYNADDGALSQGVWHCYLDGVLQGSVTNDHVVSGTTSSQYFHLAGRTTSESSFSGYLDCWRASKTALVPSQFMNATTGATAATDVLALWPINSDGVYIDGQDVIGSYDFSVPGSVASTYKITASTDRAVSSIPNPDSSADFKGDPSINSGSCVFATPEGGGSKAFLSSLDPTLTSELELKKSFTFEGWFKRTQNPGSWQVLFATSDYNPNTSTGSFQVNLSYRSNGYVLWVSTALVGKILIQDVPFGGDTDDGSTGVWRHVALVHDAETGNGIWTLYINGIQQGDPLENSEPVPSTTAPVGIFLGRRPWAENSFIGAMDSLRITQGILSPSQFLSNPGNPKETLIVIF